LYDFAIVLFHIDDQFHCMFLLVRILLMDFFFFHSYRILLLCLSDLHKLDNNSLGISFYSFSNFVVVLVVFRYVVVLKV